MSPLILASASSARREMLARAGVPFESHPVRVDEDAIRDSLVAEGANPRSIADTLAEFKARRAADRNPDRLILASDQILALKQDIFSKPATRSDAAGHLTQLSGKTHHLYSAAVIFEDAKPVWRHVGVARMTMHALTTPEIEAYLDATWPSVSDCVGAYRAEGEGVRLFSRIDGDWYSVLGLPLLEVLSYLRLRGDLTP
nr:nucleoside triphosphate pyrophosphatase [Hasllibacter sp. MH4015]